MVMGCQSCPGVWICVSCSLGISGGLCSPLLTSGLFGFTLPPPELFPAPGLTASPLQPIEGSSVTLSCNTRLPSDRATTQLRYSFFKDGHTLRSEWTSPKFTISAIWKEDSGNYWCEAMTASHSVLKRSQRSYIDVESEHQWVGPMGLSQAGRTGAAARLQAPPHP